MKTEFTRISIKGLKCIYGGQVFGNNQCNCEWRPNARRVILLEGTDELSNSPDSTSPMVDYVVTTNQYC